MDKVAIVTGAASGLGLATVNLLLSKGYKVSAWDINPVPVSSPDLLQFIVDVTDSSSISKALDETISKFSKVDVLLTAAGIALLIPTINKKITHPLSAFERVIKINLIGTFDVCRQVSKYMNNGVIINVASINAYQATRGLVAYGGSKGGVAGLAMPMARDLAHKGTRVVCISPGGFDTAMTSGIKPEYKAKGLKAIASGREGQPQEFANAVMYAIENKYLNGCNINLDGGLIQPNI